MTERCQQCGAALSREQMKNQNRCCSPACARALKASQPKPCAQCGAPIPTRTKGRRFCNQACAKAYRRHEAKPSATPIAETEAPLSPVRPDPQEPAQRVVGDVLGTEGGYTYTAHGQWVTRTGRGAVVAEWERLSNWGPGLAAWRRCHETRREIEPETRWNGWRQYPQMMEEDV